MSSGGPKQPPASANQATRPALAGHAGLGCAHSSELVAWIEQDREARAVTPVPLGQLRVHGVRVASFGRHIDDERGPAGQRCELQRAAVEKRATERVHARAAGAARHVSPRKGGCACSAARDGAGGGAGGDAQHLLGRDGRWSCGRALRHPPGQRREGGQQRTMDRDKYSHIWQPPAPLTHEPSAPIPLTCGETPVGSRARARRSAHDRRAALAGSYVETAPVPSCMTPPAPTT